MKRLLGWRPRTFGEWVTLGVLGLGLVWLGAQLWNLQSPRLRGRTAPEWIDQWLEPMMRQGREAGEPAFRARTALLDMGPQALPALVDVALTDSEDRPLRRFVRPVINLFGGHVGYPGEKAGLIQGLVADLAPRASEFVPLVEPVLREPGASTSTALSLLGGCRDVDGVEAERWERRRQLGGDGFPVDVCESVLIRLRPISPPGVAAAIRRVKAVAQAGNGDWDAFYAVATAGEQAQEAVPTLEQILGFETKSQSMSWLSMLAGVTLLEVDPGHAQAATWMRSKSWSPAFDSWNQLTNRHANSLVTVVSALGRLRSGTTLGIVESLARDQVGGWESRGLANYPTDLLERFAPDRAKVLFLGQMTSTNKDNIRLVAAGSVLRVDGRDTNAVAVLAPCLRDDHALSGLAAEQLEHAAEENPALKPVLDEALERSARVRQRWEASRARREHERRVAQHARGRAGTVP